ncbi:MAG: hypothetical protein JWQ35_42 [Bacteriovoracaceae bacterium]|nr:hypothetical protein [Bacteriovoracaceae bacterium]
MKFEFFAPTVFEVPPSFRKKTKIFGMGQKNAEKLGRELSNLSANITLVIFGCAGSLREDFKPGDIFVITKLPEGSLQSVPGLREARLASSMNILKTPEQKRIFKNKTNADLVDMEMECLWKVASPEIRAKMIFIRGVIDGTADDISFLSEQGVNWKKLLSPNQLLKFLKFIFHWRQYLKKMNLVLQRIDT